MREYKMKPLPPLAVAVAALLALSGCGSLTGRETEVETVSQAIEVHTATAGYGTIDRQTQFVGRVEAAESVKVYATTSAKVIEANAAPGERVEKGQLLFALDTEMLEIAAETARLQYEASVSGADTAITQAKNAYDNAREGYSDLWEIKDEVDYNRSSTYKAMNQAAAAAEAASKAVDAYLAKLAAAGVDISKADADNDADADQDADADTDQDKDDDSDKEAGNKWDPESDATYISLLRQEEKAAQAYQAARSAYLAAESQYETVQDQSDNTRKTVTSLRDTYRNTAGDEEAGIVGTAQSQVDLARISYDNAVKNLNDARVYAPVSGIVSVKNVSVSDFASPGVPLYVIEPEGDAPVVSFNLSEDGANALSVGSPVTVIYNGAEYPAAITELANTANPQTGLYAAKAQTDQPLPTSRSGGVVKVQASTAKAENELLLSLDLLEYDGNQPYVYVYKNGVAARVDVVTGISSADDIVILSGLTEDDRIITTWHPDLKDGAAVILAE